MTRAAVVTGVVVAVIRRLVSSGRDEYAIWPDEPAQLAMSRFFGGGTRWDMHDHSVWRPAYAALLSPIHWFTSDPVTIFHAGLTLNAILGGVSAGLVVVLTRRLTGRGPWGCALVALIVSLTPSMLFTTDFVWSEALLVPLFLATLLATLRFRDHPSPGRAALAGALATLAFATHSRMIPLAVLVAGVIVFEAVRRRAATRTAVVGLGVIVAGLAAAVVATRVIVAELWNDPAANNSVDAVTERATGIGPVLISLAGQSWYLLASTLGVVAFGAVGLVGAMRGRQQRPTRSDAVVVSMLVLACAGLSVVFMAGRLRADQVVYGRYVDAVMAPVLVVGLARLADSARSVRDRWTTALVAVATMLGAALVLVAFRHDALDSGDGLEPMILGLQPFLGSAPQIQIVRVTALAALGALAVTAVVSIRRRTMAAVGATAVILLVTGGVLTAGRLHAQWPNRGGRSAVSEVADTALAGGRPVDYYLAPGSDATDALMLYQMYLPHSEFTVIDDAVAGATAPYVFAPTNDASLRRSGATLVWTEPGRRIGLWKRPA